MPIGPDAMPELVDLSFKAMDAAHQMYLDQERFVNETLAQWEAERSAQVELERTLRDIAAAKSPPVVVWAARNSGFLRPAFGMIGLVGAALLCGSMVMAQAMGSGVVVDEKLLVSWPMLVLAVAGAAGYGGVAWSVAAHHKNTDIHLTLSQLGEKLTPREVCHLQHVALCDELAGIKNGIEEIKRDMPRRQR